MENKWKMFWLVSTLESRSTSVRHSSPERIFVVVVLLLTSGNCIHRTRIECRNKTFHFTTFRMLFRAGCCRISLEFSFFVLFGSQRKQAFQHISRCLFSFFIDFIDEWRVCLSSTMETDGRTLPLSAREMWIPNLYSARISKFREKKNQKCKSNENNAFAT